MCLTFPKAAALLVRGGTPMLEHLILMRNRILSEEKKKQVVWLNLDYCGGCPKSHSVDICAPFMQSVLGHLPSLQPRVLLPYLRQHFGKFFAWWYNYPRS
jgi:hypothetical protein